MNVSRIESVLPGVPLIESPFFDEILTSNYFSEFEAEIAKDLNLHGFAVLPNYFKNIDQQARQIKSDLRPIFKDCKSNGDQILSGIQASRIQDGFRFSQTVKDLACDAGITQLLTNLYGRQAFAFQTLNFEYGSQQAAHSDAVHFHSVPERFMCGIWIALEDVTIDAGPLLYYPRSHRLPLYDPRQVGFIPSNETDQTVYEPMWNKLIEVNGLEKKVFTAKAGDALIWTANLLHGGDAIIRPGATRWSQVTHYFFEDCGYYTPMQSDLFDGKILKRDPIDISSGLNLSNLHKLKERKSHSDQSLQTTTHQKRSKPIQLLVQSLLNLFKGKAKSQNPEQFIPNIQLPKDFDSKDYLRLNPDVLAANFDPALHYVTHGFLEHRIYKLNIPDRFDRTAYLELNPDVAASELTAEAHYTLYGYRENRPYHH